MGAGVAGGGGLGVVPPGFNPTVDGLAGAALPAEPAFGPVAGLPKAPVAPLGGVTVGALGALVTPVDRPLSVNGGSSPGPLQPTAVNTLKTHAKPNPARRATDTPFRPKDRRSAAS